MKIERPVQVDVLVLTVDETSSEGKFCCCKNVIEKKSFNKKVYKRIDFSHLQKSYFTIRPKEII